MKSLAQNLAEGSTRASRGLGPGTTRALRTTTWKPRPMPAVGPPHPGRPPRPFPQRTGPLPPRGRPPGPSQSAGQRAPPGGTTRAGTGGHCHCQLSCSALSLVEVQSSPCTLLTARPLQMPSVPPHLQWDGGQVPRFPRQRSWQPPQTRGRVQGSCVTMHTTGSTYWNKQEPGESGPPVSS